MAELSPNTSSSGNMLCKQRAAEEGGEGEEGRKERIEKRKGREKRGVRGQ